MGRPPTCSAVPGDSTVTVSPTAMSSRSSESCRTKTSPGAGGQLPPRTWKFAIRSSSSGGAANTCSWFGLASPLTSTLLVNCMRPAASSTPGRVRACATMAAISSASTPGPNWIVADAGSVLR
jgi:hypothetical protein